MDVTPWSSTSNLLHWQKTYKGKPLTVTLEDWVEMTDDGLGASAVFKIPDVALADIVEVSTSSTEVVKTTVSSIE